MATISIEELMKASISNEDLASIDLGTAEEASERSLRSFVAQQAGADAAEPKESKGLIHFTGPAIIGHSVPINAIGKALTAMQTAIDAIGASKSGYTSLNGQIPARIKAKTELRMEASPLAGSIVINVRPSMPRLEDLYPDGPTLFDLEEQGVRPLADECFEDFLEILSSTSDDSPAYEGLVDILTGFGPRTSSAIREFCNSLDKDSLDVDFKWEEPRKKPIRGEMNHARAKFVSTIIRDTEVEVEETTLMGMLVSSTLQKDIIRLRLQDGTEQTLAPGTIPSEELMKFGLGDNVIIKAERRVAKYTGGHAKTKLFGISMQADSQASIESD